MAVLRNYTDENRNAPLWTHPFLEKCNCINEVPFNYIPTYMNNLNQWTFWLPRSGKRSEMAHYCLLKQYYSTQRSHQYSYKIRFHKTRARLYKWSWPSTQFTLKACQFMDWICFSFLFQVMKEVKNFFSVWSHLLLVFLQKNLF